MAQRKILKSCLVLLSVFLSVSFKYSVAESLLEETVLCDDLYECPTDSQSPFKPGNIYFYAFHVNSTLMIEKVLNRQLQDGDQPTTKTISKDGYIAMTPFTSCEIGILHRESRDPSWKIVFYNGTIHRVCSSYSNPDPKSNMLKALVSLFQVNPTSRDDLPAGFTIENDSKGKCLTKIIQCSGSKTKYIKFKSTRLCSINDDVTIEHNLKYEIQQFQTGINKYTSINDLCESSSSDLNSESETSDKRTGITTCIIEKNGEGLVTSASCTEEEDALELSPAPIVNGRYFGSASLKLGDIMSTIVPTAQDIRFSFYKTNIRQLDVIKGVHDVDAKSAESEDKDFIPRMEIVFNKLTNSTKRAGLKSHEVQETINEFRQLIRGSSNSENLVKYLEQHINSSTSEKPINFFLSMLPLEASEENVLKFWSSILTKNLLQDQISHDDLENQLLKLLTTLSNIVPTVKVIEFCKLIVDYVEDEDNGVSNNLKIVTFMTFSQLLNQFCNRMEEQNGESFCTKNAIIQSWVNSTILQKIMDNTNHFDQIIRLESFTNLKSHSSYICEQIFDERKADSLGLWTLLSCFRDEPCNSKSKDFFRKLIEDKDTRSNAKITAFLAMSKCFDNEDERVIRNIFDECEPHNKELLNFIAQYKENRDFYGKTEEALEGIEVQSESGCALRRTRTTSQSPKITRGSNTFTIIKIPTLPMQLSLQTNMLYFDSPNMIPELVVLKLGAVTAVKRGAPVVDKTILEVHFYVDKSKSESMLNYLVTVVVRKFGKTVSLKDITVTEEKLNGLYQLLQRKLGEMSQTKETFKELALGKFYDIIRKVLNLDIFKVIALPSRSKYIRTISGIPQRMQWDVDGFTGFTIQKQDCLGVMGGNVNEPTCQSNLNPVFNLEMSLSLGIGYPDTNQFHIEGLRLQSNLTAELPLSLLFTRGMSNKESSIELIVPSLKRALVKAGVEVRSTEESADSIARWNYKLSLDGFYGPSSCPFSTDSDSKTMKIGIFNNWEQKTLSLKIADVRHEATLELRSDPLYSIHGNLSYLTEIGLKPKSYTFEVGVKNIEDLKRLQMKLTKGEFEYSMDVYYIKKFQKPEAARYSGWGCRAQSKTGILCRWPFCMFCGEEHFVGATISTPRFKNIKLLEGSVTQVFPEQRIDIVLKTLGIFKWHNGHFKASVTRAANISLIHSPNLREQVKMKIREHKINETEPTDDGDDARTQNMLVYSFTSEVSNELLGSAGVSCVFMNSHVDLYGGELIYPSGTQQKASFLTTIFTELHNANVTRGNVAETMFRSSQFPILDFDSKVRTQITSSNSDKKLLAIKPINLGKGEIKLETIDNVNKYDATKSWTNFHIDQTYKLYLPEQFLTRFFKGRIVIERVEEVIQDAALEVLVGSQNGLEIRYDFIPDEDNAVEFLTSVTAKGEIYGMHHRLEPVKEIVSNGDADTHSDAQKYKYKGTYIFEDSSMKAVGVFVARNDREILPFSKFDVRVSSVDGIDLGIRIFGAETIESESNIHNIKLNIEKGETKVFEFKNEINPSDEVPIKATIYLKDYGEAKIFDSTKVPNKRNLQVKMKWPTKKQIIQGKISFPTSITEPLYLDLDISVVNEVTEESVMKLVSSSLIGFYNFNENLKNLSVSTKNVMELKNQRWEAGLEGVYIKEIPASYDENPLNQFNRRDNFTLLTYYVPPELKTYLINIQYLDYSSRRRREESYNYLLKAERPDVTPLHLQLNIELDDGHQPIITLRANHTEIEYSAVDMLSMNGFLKVCHRENFLYIFPMLDVDFSIKNVAELERNITNYHSGHNEFADIGKLTCSSTGINLPICNQINLSYKFNSEFVDNYGGPLVANMTLENDNRNNIKDILNVKLRANYENVREARKSSKNDYFGNDNVVGDILNTVIGPDLMKYSYSLDYNLRRESDDEDNNVNNQAINGSYAFSRMFESWDFFEISDQHQWSQIDNGNLYIWTNLVNHTTDINQTSESATFSSQYVSLGEEESNNNITWMQLRSSLDSNGFGLLQNIILQPSTLLNTYEGTVNADLLIKTEFSPVKTFRVLVSHDHNKNENEDDESTKYDTLSELNLILNEREISCTNFLTAAEGKMMGVGNTFMGKCRSKDGINEYVTVKTFVVCPKNFLDLSQDNLVHVDVSSSWTNKDDDDTDLRISNDLIYGPTTNGIPMIRLTYSENSTDIDVERNGSIFIFQKVANMEMTEELRLTETVISDSLDVLSFTQTSLQGISQQIVDDYFNVTNLNEVQTDSGRAWVDYNINWRSNIVEQGNSSNSQFNAKWFGFEERLYHCQSLYHICTDNGTNSTDNFIDTSNYCNLAILPAKHVMYAIL